MNVPRHPVATVLCAGLFAVSLASAQAAPSSVPTDKYIAGQGAQFEPLAGSKENLTSLATGLRTSSEITLIEQTPTGPKVTTFTPPTKPMGYGNITRSLELANRQLASLGITDPTAAELKAALNGGTVKTANGDAQLAGVLNLRSQGMGFGKIAHTIGVHPSGHASAKVVATAPVPGSKSTTSAASGAGKSTVVTAAGAKGASASAPGHSASRSGIVTAAGGSASSPGAHGRGHANAVGAGGASSGSGIQTAGGRGGGNGHAFGRAGK